MDNQLLLFAEPKNYHLQYLSGRPIGAYSLREFCVTRVEDNPELYTRYYDRGREYRVTMRQAKRDSVELQQELYALNRDGLINLKGVWQKQRAHYRRFLRDLHAGNAITTNKARR